jgi:hypothetical protein
MNNTDSKQETGEDFLRKMKQTEEFICCECGNIFLLKEKGNAVDENDNPIDVCKNCCYEEQKNQFLTNL